MLKLIGSSLDQWETGRKFQVLPCPDGRKINFVDFAHPGDEVALTVVPLQDGDIVIAEIPNILLQSSEDLMVYARIDSETIYRTKRSVYKREKPADYLYTETEVLTYKVLEDRISNLEQCGSVRYDSQQELTEAEQAQARENIGVDEMFSPDDVLNILCESGVVDPIATNIGELYISNAGMIYIF